MKIQNDLLTKYEVAEATAEALVNTEATAEKMEFVKMDTEVSEKLKFLEIFNKISVLTQEQKQFLFDLDFQQVFENLKGYEKNTQGHGYNYANLKEVSLKIKDIIKGKFYYIHTNNKKYLKTTVRHLLTGLEISSVTAIPTDEMLGTALTTKNLVQKFGAWQTYTKRYHLIALFGLSEEDDGAQSLTENKQQPTVKQPDNIGKPINIDNLKKEAERKQLGKNIADMINNKELVTIDEVKNFIKSDDNYKDDLQYFLGEKVLAKFIEYLNKANK
jgi:hypothetical protein